jgi:hypothetical protein
MFYRCIWSYWPDLNRRPADYERSSDLPLAGKNNFRRSSIPRSKETAGAASVVIGDGVFQLLAADPEVSGLTVQTEIAGSGKAEELSVEGNLV